MKVWLDEQISPFLASWISAEFNVECVGIAELGLEGSKDREIFDRARSANAIVMSKDRDFVDLLSELGPPPQLIWLTCGNRSNEALKLLLTATLGPALELLTSGDPIVQIA